MKYCLTALLLAALAAGCGGGPPVPESSGGEPGVDTGPADVAPEDVMENINMHLWPSTDTPGEDVKPLLSIQAERVTGMGGGTEQLTFEGARAVVPAREPGDLEINFVAERGSYVEGKRAVLEGGVVARIDDMTIELEDIVWEIVPGLAGAAGQSLAASDNPLRITSPTQQLEASSLRLRAGAKMLELRDVSGEFTFTGDMP